MATACTKKSAAYEAGLREGRADKSKQPKVEIEISPEGEEEQGPDKEEMDGASGKTTNRKRSAKNAKSTKAPMDGGMYGKKPMDAECGCGGKGRKGQAACDGSCGGMKKDRADSALTPQEYLAACDLGIQGRSRLYIRARLDAAERLDLKCGRGAISESKKCHKGTAQRVQPEGGGSAGSSNLIRSAEAKLARTAGNKAALTSRELTAVSEYYRAQQQRPVRRIARAVKTAASVAMAAGSIAGLVGSLSRASKAGRRASLERAYRGPSAKRDAIYASGFTADLAQLAI